MQYSKQQLVDAVKVAMSMHHDVETAKDLLISILGTYVGIDLNRELAIEQHQSNIFALLEERIENERHELLHDFYRIVPGFQD